MPVVATRRQLLKSMGIAAVGFAAAACRPAAPTTPTAPGTEQERAAETKPEVAPAATGPVDVRVHTNMGYQWWGWIEAAWEQNVDGFRDKHPNINMVGEPVAGWTDDYFPKIFTHVAAGTLGDIVWFPPRMRNHISWGMLYNIVIDHMPLVEADDYDLTQFFPGVIESSS